MASFEIKCDKEKACINSDLQKIELYIQIINIVCGRWLAKALPCLLGYQGSSLDNEPPYIQCMHAYYNVCRLHVWHIHSLYTSYVDHTMNIIFKKSN